MIQNNAENLQRDSHDGQADSVWFNMRPRDEIEAYMVVVMTREI
jgi:hypothetical protein